MCFIFDHFTSIVVVPDHISLRVLLRIPLCVVLLDVPYCRVVRGLVDFLSVILLVDLRVCCRCRM